MRNVTQNQCFIELSLTIHITIGGLKWGMGMGESHDALFSLYFNYKENFRDYSSLDEFPPNRKQSGQEFEKCSKLFLTE